MFRRPWLIVAGVALVAVAAWYLWPVTGGGSGDVAAVGDETFQSVDAPLGRQVRDRGRGYHSLPSVADWCQLAQQLPTTVLADDVDVLVIAVEQVGTCATDPVAAVLAQLDDRGIEPVLVAYPGSTATEVDARIVLTEQLLGGPEQLTAACQWWDDCPAEGSVQVRSAPGELTDVGADRVARMVAATIG